MKKSIMIVVAAGIVIAFKSDAAPVNPNYCFYDNSRTYALEIAPLDANKKIISFTNKISSKGKRMIGDVKKFVSAGKLKGSVLQVYVPMSSDERRGGKTPVSYVIDSIPARVHLTPNFGKWEYYKLKDKKTDINMLLLEKNALEKDPKSATVPVQLEGITTKDLPTTPYVFVIDVGATVKNNISIKIISLETAKTKYKSVGWPDSI